MSDSTPARAIMRLAAAAGIAVAAGLSGVSFAHAQDDRCARLEAQLAAASVGGRANPTQISRYDAAIATQHTELDKAERQAERGGCLAGSASAICLGLLATRDRMERNLADLLATRDRMAAGMAAPRESERIAAAIEREGCRTATTVAQDNVRRLPPPISERQSGPNAGVRILGGSYSRTGESRRDERYRTVCVRMCDGYFFPVSQSATVAMFGHDESLCRARCPGTATELHFRATGQEPADMLSVASGRRYGEISTAFAYRRTDFPRPAGCGCNEAGGYAASGGERGWSELGAELRPSAEPAPEETAAVPEPRELPEDRRVRVVGPTFLPDREGAIDLRSPAPRPGP